MQCGKRAVRREFENGAPVVGRPTRAGSSEERAGCIFNEVALRSGAVGATLLQAKTIQRRQLPGGCELENCSAGARLGISRSAIEVAIITLHYTGVAETSISVSAKTVQSGQAACGSDFENCSAAVLGRSN